MAVDAVMSMVGTGLGDAVVEVVYRVVLAHAGHIGADWHVGSFEQSSVGIPHVVGGAMVVDAVMSMVSVGLGDAGSRGRASRMGSHKRWRPRHEGSRIGGAMVGAALR